MVKLKKIIMDKLSYALGMSMGQNFMHSMYRILQPELRQSMKVHNRRCRSQKQSAQ